LRELDVKYFNHIPSTFTAASGRGLIFARLGYKKGKTELKEKDCDFINEQIEQALLLCQARGAMCFCPIKECGDNKVVLADGTEFLSARLAKFLANSREVVLMAATLGREISTEIARAVEKGNPVTGLVFDAVASQVVDAALDWLMDLINKMIKIKGQSLTKHRFSPGYGDLGLEHQKIIYDLLDLKRLDMAITDKFMLEPEKSVIAIAGIEVAN